MPACRVRNVGVAPTIAILLLCGVLAGCKAQSSNDEIVSAPPVDQPGTPVATKEWRTDPSCLQNYESARSWADCLDDNRTSDFTAVSLSGGGTKATVFGGEALFYLDALGWLQRANMISAVSGGSFAASLYAVSCDRDDKLCQESGLAGTERPVWSHGEIMRVLGLGNRPLIRQQIARVLIPGVPMVISAQRFGSYIEDRFLRDERRGPRRVTMADVNPRRPPLFLNATIISENRGGLADLPEKRDGKVLCAWNKLGQNRLRRRTPDEFFHFAFSPLYFRSIGAEWASYPLGEAVAASAAFPALIEAAIVRDYCKKDISYLRLMDGGANDNQALIEIYATATELLLHQRRSPPDLQPSPMRDGEHIQALVINSSVTETTGLPQTSPPDRPHELAGFVGDLFDRITSATDTYSGVGYNLRKQLYLHELAELKPPYAGRIHPIEISLTELDQYALGGSEAQLRRKAGIDPYPLPQSLAALRAQSSPGPEGATGPGEELDRMLAGERRLYQGAAYRDLMALGAAERARRYHLSAWHPQCYFNIRADLDKALSAVTPDDQACVREAAGWATVLRAQEQCERDALDPAAHRPTGLGCSADHLVNMPGAPSLLDGNEHLTGHCTLVPARYQKEQQDLAKAEQDAVTDPDATCQPLR